MLDRAAADDGGYEVGDEVVVLTPTRTTYRLVGIMAFGEADSAGGTVQAQFLTEEAQRIFGAPGQFDTVLARSDEVSPQDLVTSIEDAVPADLEVVTGEQAAEEMADDVTQAFGFFRQILLVFGAIALLVATFIIYNTFSILVAQRSREMALLRAVGASRRQVLTSVLVEAVIVGFVAAVLGLLVVWFSPMGVTALLEGFGVELPSATLVVRPFTIGMAFLVGVVVTTLAAVVPAIRATRVLPIAALRDVAIDRSSRSLAAPRHRCRGARVGGVLHAPRPRRRPDHRRPLVRRARCRAAHRRHRRARTSHRPTPRRLDRCAAAEDQGQHRQAGAPERLALSPSAPPRRLRPS